VNLKHSNAILIIVIILAGIGVVMVLSVTINRSESLLSNKYFLWQTCWVSLGFIAMLVASRIDYNKWKKVAIVLGVISAILLALVFVPGIGLRINGASRWIKIGPVRFQPSEIAKVAMVIACAYILSVKGSSFKGSFIPVMAVGGFVAVLILLEPDFGTAVLIMAVCLAMVFAAGVSLRYISLALLPLLATGAALIWYKPYRLARIVAFWNPEAGDSQSPAVYHIRQSLITIGSGGIFGVGLGESRQTRYFLPESSTDFIYAIISEQFGFIGAIALVALYAALIYFGLKAALAANDAFGRFLAFGITALVGGQAVMNILVVTACVPTKGIALPFISRGGSSVACMMLLAGILANVALQARVEESHPQLNAVEAVG